MSIINLSTCIESYFEDNVIYMKSRNLYGELGTGKIGDGTEIYVATKPFDSEQEKLYVTDTNIYLLKNNILYGTGSNFYNQISNNSNIKNVTKFTLILDGVIRFYIYQETLFAIRNNNRIYSWGCNVYGLSGNGTRKFNSLPTILRNMQRTNIEYIVFGENVCVTVSKSSIMIWGKTRNKQVFIDGKLVYAFPKNIIYTCKPKAVKLVQNLKCDIDFAGKNIMISKK